jgi:predicted  nucleic acid-binding Zn-ribbon protein
LHGQRWTDGLRIYSDDGSWALDGHETTEDLVEYIGPLPDSSRRAPVSRSAETESTTARYISTNEALDEKTAEIDRLRIELQETYAGWSGSNSALAEQTEFTAAQQLRSEVQQLERLLDDAREELQQLQADQAADEQHSEGERAAYLGMIKALWEMRS